MTKELVPDIKTEDWYQRIVEDCASIAIEKTYRSRIELIEGKHSIGERIVTDPHYQKNAKGNRALINALGHDIGGVSESDLYLCIAFYQKYPDLQKFLDEATHGKNLSWTKVTQRYLYDTKESKDEEKELCKHDFVDLKKCSKCRIIVAKVEED